MPCDLRAVSAGSAFPVKAFPFSVHSVFPRALNLKSACGGLLSLVAERRQVHPRAALLPGGSFEDWGLPVGASGFFDGSCLRFDDTALSVPLVVLPGSRRSPLDEGPQGRIGVSPEKRKGAVKAAIEMIGLIRAKKGIEPHRAAALEASGPKEFETRLSRRGEIGMRLAFAAKGLEAAVGERSVSRFLEAELGMIGLGEGLTPSGDDFLCGCLAGLRMKACKEADLRDFLDRCGIEALERGMLARTNDISAAFLFEAMRGRFGEALLDFAEAVAAADESSLQRAAMVLSALGHSSGTDAAEGFLFAFSDELGG